MIAVIDKKMPEAAKEKLSGYCEFIELETNQITFDYLSGHPDIFFTQIDDKLVVAPNIPQEIREKLELNGIDYIEGCTSVSDSYPGYSAYNVAVANKYIIHDKGATDNIIKQNMGNRKFIHVRQSLSKCSTLCLKENVIITSDMGIHKTCLQNNLDSSYIAPNRITLPGQKYGLLGGCFGVSEDKLFICGSLSKFSAGNLLKNLISKNRYELVELYDGPLFDCGSILFLNF